MFDMNALLNEFACCNAYFIFVCSWAFCNCYYILFCSNFFALSAWNQQMNIIVGL